MNSEKLGRQEALSPAIGYNGRAGEKTVLVIIFLFARLTLNSFARALIHSFLRVCHVALAGAATWALSKFVFAAYFFTIGVSCSYFYF